jgi:Coenzyme PQQ synthesis protein D (PqqD)
MNVRLRPDVVTTDTDHGTVLLDLLTGRYWQLNPTGTRILNALRAGETPARTATDLAETHDLPIERANADVTATIDELHAAKLVVTP